jgi:ribonuclease HI
MIGWGCDIPKKIDIWFGKSFPLKIKHSLKKIDFWIQETETLVSRIFSLNSFKLLEKAIVFISAAIDRIYIHNPDAIILNIKKNNYIISNYNNNLKLEEQLTEFNLFSDASVKELKEISTIAGLIKNKNNEIILVYRDKISYELFNDSNVVEMLAIYEGLKIAIEMKIKKIKIFTDSMCAVEKIEKYNPYCNTIFSDIVLKIMNEIKKFEMCEIVHIKRNHNSIADEMTKF